MKAICPTDRSHKRFVTVAHVTQDWIVDDTGNFIEVYGYDMQIVASPHPDNEWTCAECGANAEVTRG